MNRTSFVFTALLALAVPAAGTFFSSDAHAEAALGPASSFVKGKYDNVIKFLGEKPSPEREKKLDAELASLVDYDEMAKAVLGGEAGNRKPEEIARFTSVLKELIQINYKKKLTEITKYKVTYKAELADGADTKVQTEAKDEADKKAIPVTIDYKVKKKGGGWIVVDIIPEDSSYVKAWNKELIKVVKKDGWDAMMKKLDDKLAKEKAGTATPAKKT